MHSIVAAKAILVFISYTLSMHLKKSEIVKRVPAGSAPTGQRFRRRLEHLDSEEQYFPCCVPI